MRTPRLPALLIALALVPSAAADPPPGVPVRPSGPLSPVEELATFSIVPGFRATLAASEPDVVDPVAMAFDERGRLWVCEMRGYPNGGVGTGQESRGRVRILSDVDGDGSYETARTFADGLRFPMGVLPWKGGALVAVAPDILYLEDTDGDGTADRRTVLYTGFDTRNIQQMVNGLTWGLDNWVYGIAGNPGGVVRSAERPDAPAVELRGRGFRFRPDRPGSLEPTSGGGQYGLTADDAGHWFTATNSNHLRQIVLPDHYLRRNPAAPVTAVAADIPDHGASCKLFRLSPFEGWRVERTARRAGGPDAKRFRDTELVPGGFSSSSCSPVVLAADLFPPAFRGNVLVCDPGNNLIHRDALDTSGAAFVARRADADCEFLASSDNWFRPVDLKLGPDGAVYVLDFYREVIETPLSLPDDIKAKLNLESRGRGRVWRIAPDGFKPGKVSDLSKLTTIQLADQLTDPNQWVRLTAQRLLVERGGKDAVAKIAELGGAAAGKPWRPNLLYALREFDALPDDLIAAALADPLPGNREVGLRLAEGRFDASPDLRAAAMKLTADPSPMVRFQLALSAGFLPPPDAARVLAAVAVKDGDDVWTQSAVLMSARSGAVELLEAMLAAPGGDGGTRFLARLATLVGAGDDADARLRLLRRVADAEAADSRALAMLEGVGQGMRTARPNLPKWLVTPPSGSEAIAGKIRDRLADAGKRVTDPVAPSAVRLTAARLLAYAPLDVASGPLTAVLTPQSPSDLQLAAVRSLADRVDPSVPELLLKAWPSLGPSLRREVQEQLLATPARTTALLDAVAAGTVRPAELDPARVAQLRAHPTVAVRDRAVKLLAGQGAADRKKVIADYAGLADLPGDATRGRTVFQKQCAACHKIGTDGHEVGPNLLAAVPGKSTDDLLVALFDPNREVDPRYVNYLLSTADGRALTGVIVADTPAAVTLRRSDGSEDTVRREDIETLKATGLSLMPEGLEKSLPKSDLADLFAFLRQATGKK